ncbi:AraC family transcriptional regulator [Ferrovibrio xuzhouensis]|uniref:AraC family transcriptional regulator n=1 Tax=Ferrovibrio xuzhouensis TaxID=1576914 RepID=A0ABV7VCL2_9PROT
MPAPVQPSKPPAPPRSVAAGYVHTLLDAVAASGGAPGQVTAAAVLAAAGLPAGLVAQAHDGRLPHDAVSAIWQAALRLTGDRHLGLHVGERVQPGSFDALGHLLMTCDSLREAARQAERFAPLVGGGGRFAARDEGDGICLLYQPFDPDWPCRRHRVEAVLSATVTFTRWLCGAGVRPQQVRFRHAAPDSLDEYRRIFGCPVQFDAAEDSLPFDAETLALPVRLASPGLKAVLAGHAQAALDLLGSGDPLRDAVARAIRAALAAGDVPGIDAVAAALQTTPRTLQRRLAERGTGLQAEVARGRCALAQELLRDPQHSIAAVAARLGFADTANFHRAFKGWTGRTAALWRRDA